MSGAFGLHAILGAALSAGLGAWMLFFHDQYLAMRRRQHERELADRLTRGADAYFEEQRSLHAYAPGLLPVWQRRLGGAHLLLFGFGYLALAVAGGGRP